MRKTAEELIAMAEENGLKLSPEQANELSMHELTDEDVEMISGGQSDGEYPGRCPKRSSGRHTYRKTGNTKPGKIWGLNYEVRCMYCGETKWLAFEPDE